MLSQHENPSPFDFRLQTLADICDIIHDVSDSICPRSWHPLGTTRPDHLSDSLISSAALDLRSRTASPGSRDPADLSHSMSRSRSWRPVEIPVTPRPASPRGDPPPLRADRGAICQHSITAVVCHSDGIVPWPVRAAAVCFAPTLKRRPARCTGPIQHSDLPRHGAATGRGSRSCPAQLVRVAEDQSWAL